MLRLILGRAGTGKTARVMGELARAVQNRVPGNLLIVPEQYSHEAERELCAVCGDAMSLCAEVLSFTRLCGRVEDELGKKPLKGAYLDQGGRLLCLALCLDAVGSRLSVYGEARRRPELQKSLLNALDEFKSANVTPDILAAAGVRCGGALSKKLADLALLMEGYQAVVQNAGADPADRLTVLAESLAASAAGASGGVYIDGFLDFTAQELAVIRAFLKKGAALTVCLTCDEGDRTEIFEPSLRTAAALRRMASELGIETETEVMETPRRAAGALGFLEKHLWGYSSETFADEKGAVSLVACPGQAGECALAAALALELVRKTGCRWRDIAVAVRGFGDYRSGLESAFERYGVPLFTARRGSVLEKPLPVLINAAYETISGYWDYAELFTGLKTGLWGLDAGALDELENYVILWSLSGPAWTKDADWRLHPRGYGEPLTEDDGAALARINALRRRVSGPLLGLAASGERAKTARAHAEALAAFLEALGLASTLAARSEALRARGQAEVAAEYAQLWDITANALEQTAAVLGEAEMTQETFARLFRLLLGCYDVSAIPASLDSVSAGDMDRMRRRNIKHLIVLGASDDRLPRLEDGAGLFSPDERERLSELELGLGGADEAVFRELSLIYNCLTLPSETLCLAYSPKNADGSDARPAFVMQGAARLLGKPIRSADTGALMAGAPGPAFELAVSGTSPAAERYFREKGEGDRLDALRRAAALPRGPLSEASVRALYGPKPRLSASRVDAFAACRFKYFLQYGLRAKPREPAGFDPPRYGSFMHYILENVAREVSENGGFKAVAPAEIEKLADKYVARYARDELNDFRERSERFKYLFRRLTATVRRVVLDMAAELAASDFAPLDFELRFSEAGDLPPVAFGEGEEAVFFSGVADRVDGWVHEGKLYLRVMDYKTGLKGFSLSDVCRGMGLQMLLYLFALEREGARRYGQEIVPAGVLYIPARSAALSAEREPDEAEAEAERAKRLKRSGLLLNDPRVLAAMEDSLMPKYIPVKYGRDGSPSGDALAGAEQLGKLARFIDGALSDLAKALRRGSVAADPYYRSQTENACRFCEFKDACQFMEGRDGRRYLNNLKPAEAWPLIEGTPEPGGKNGTAREAAI